MIDYVGADALVRTTGFCLCATNFWRAYHRLGRGGRPRPPDREPLWASRRCPYLQINIIKQYGTLHRPVISSEVERSRGSGRRAAVGKSAMPVLTKYIIKQNEHAVISSVSREIPCIGKRTTRTRLSQNTRQRGLRAERSREISRERIRTQRNGTAIYTCPRLLTVSRERTRTQ